jgi:hypothetical protein
MTDKLDLNNSTSIRLAPFDWNMEAVTIPRQAAVAVYVTEQFNVVVIRQQGRESEPDAIIEVASANCVMLAAAILRESGQQRFRIVKLADDEVTNGRGDRMHIPQRYKDTLDAMGDDGGSLETGA